MIFAPKRASLGSSLRLLINKKTIISWSDDYTIAFEKIKSEIVNLTEKLQFDLKLSTRIKPHKSLGAKLEKFIGNNWRLVSFRKPNFKPSKSEAFNKQGALGVVWAVEYCKKNHYGSEFKIRTGHKALLSALLCNHGSNSYHIRLTR